MGQSTSTWKRNHMLLMMHHHLPELRQHHLDLPMMRQHRLPMMSQHRQPTLPGMEADTDMKSPTPSEEIMPEWSSPQQSWNPEGPDEHGDKQDEHDQDEHQESWNPEGPDECGDKQDEHDQDEHRDEHGDDWHEHGEAGEKTSAAGEGPNAGSHDELPEREDGPPIDRRSFYGAIAQVRFKLGGPNDPARGSNDPAPDSREPTPDSHDRPAPHDRPARHDYPEPQRAVDMNAMDWSLTRKPPKPDPKPTHVHLTETIMCLG